MIRTTGAIYIWLAFLLVMIPLEWILSAFLAAMVHETCHIIAVLLLGGNIKRFDISLTGCVLESSNMGDWQSVISILAGPAGSFLLTSFLGTAPKIAICGMIQGLYNLIPLLPLDGGRVLQCILYRLRPAKADSVLHRTGRIFCIVVLFFCVYASVALRLGVFPLILSLFWFLRWFPRKIPCKPPEIKVQ